VALDCDGVPGGAVFQGVGLFVPAEGIGFGECFGIRISVGCVCHKHDWINEDELPDGYPYHEMFPHSIVDGVRLFPKLKAKQEARDAD
jgi:hypothetical protein